MARRIETGSIDIDAIKDQFPLADEVRRHLALKRRGATLVGLCPFHMERTPSFAVYPEEQRFHCFGCGAHGDIFDFLQAQEGLDIRAAAERLTGGNFPVMSEERVVELRARQARFEAEQAERRMLAADQMRLRWAGADPTYSSHPYLTAKEIRPNGTRLDREHILVPLFDAAAAAVAPALEPSSSSPSSSEPATAAESRFLPVPVPPGRKAGADAFSVAALPAAGRASSSPSVLRGVDDPLRLTAALCSPSSRSSSSPVCRSSVARCSCRSRPISTSSRSGSSR